MNTPKPQQKKNTLNLLASLLDQNNARIYIPANQQSPGYWFGGGNMVVDETGVLWLCGRFRDYGDSRTGTDAGKRGLELAIFCSKDEGQSFTKTHSWSKADLSCGGHQVVSIEGTALHQLKDGSWEILISTEKMRSYPPGLESHQKLGTGVWSIDRITGKSLDQLKLDSIEPILNAWDTPGYLHVKDPVVFNDAQGNTNMIFCTHPFSWASGNTGLATRSGDQGRFKLQNWEFVGRGPCWDVAATRVTNCMKIPALGCFAQSPSYSIYFYDGAECMNPLVENNRAHKRPRGSSCEELGGAMIGLDEKFPTIERLSLLEPLFTSPWGTRCSRYVDTLTTQSGIYASWQQTQKDGSQPCVGHFLPMEKVESILSKN